MRSGGCVQLALLVASPVPAAEVGHPEAPSRRAAVAELLAVSRRPVHLHAPAATTQENEIDHVIGKGTFHTLLRVIYPKPSHYGLG